MRARKILQGAHVRQMSINNFKRFPFLAFSPCCVALPIISSSDKQQKDRPVDCACGERTVKCNRIALNDNKNNKMHLFRIFSFRSLLVPFYFNVTLAQVS